jgi:predicted TIM-barrel fold metal-dependent hydrolase
MVRPSKQVELATAWPDRYLFYAGCDPTQGTEACLRAIDEQVAEMPVPIAGLKLYPAQIDPVRAVSMDDPVMFPIYERCLEHGFTSVAVHKALVPGGPRPAPMAPFRPQDVDGAAGTFPQLRFEIVHAGMAFLEETALLCANHQNVFANLETTFMWGVHAPGQFEEVIARLTFMGASGKILFSSGGMYLHPQAQLEAFVRFAFSEQTLDRYGIEQITAEQKAGILGLNYARMAGLDVDAARARIAGDAFSEHQRSHGLDPPYRNWTGCPPGQAEPLR